MKRLFEINDVYAVVEGSLFSIGLIGNFPKEYIKPFYTAQCTRDADPKSLYEIWAKRLDIPAEWVMGNEVMGLGEVMYSVPTCPTCGEVTYSQPRCPFCNQLLKEPTIKSTN